MLFRSLGAASQLGQSLLLLIDPSAPAINDLISGLDYAYPQAVKVGGVACPHSASHGSLLFDDGVCDGAVGLLIGGGWAIEPVPADVEASPPRPGCSYTIGFPERFGFPEVVIFGLTPVAAKGLCDLVAERLADGVEIPLDVPVVGLLDNDLRCVFRTATVDPVLLATGAAWHRGSDFPLVQLLWPDRAGRLPYEDGFDQRVRAAQPMFEPPPLAH